MNKKHFLMLAISALSLMMSSCLKSDDDTAFNCNYVIGTPSATEIASLQAFITSNNLTATQHPGGFFYRIVNSGTTPAPTLASTVTVKYTGSLTNGTIFDQNLVGASFVLSQLIIGWRLGLPLIQKGGTIILYLPPSLGYGCSVAGTVPAGSNLVFNIELVDVQ